MRTRPVMLAAAVAAAGLVALGTVVAQQPSPTGAGQPRGSSGTLPATTVRPYTDWTPNPAPAGYVPKAPGSGVTPAGGFPAAGAAVPPPGGGRMTPPAMTPPGGLMPAGGSIPPPNMEISPFKPSSGTFPPVAGSPGVAPSAGQPLTPPAPPADTPRALPSPSLPAPPAVGTPGLPAAPALPPVGTGAATTPPAPPSVPGLPAAPALPPVPSAPAAGSPAVPAPLPTGTPSAPVTPPSPAAPVFGPAAGAAPASPHGTETPVTPAPLPTTTPAVPPAAGTPPAPSASISAGTLPARTSPSVMVEAVCPESVVFGQEFQYKLIVRNTGSVGVTNVRVEDEVPAGARYVGSDPPAEMTGDRLMWTIGNLDAGTEKAILVRLKTAEEGEVRSRATVVFAASVDARTRVTRPRLAVAVTGPEVCRAGEEARFEIKVTNSGTGPAHRTILQARLSDGLVHAQGLVIEAELPVIAPGETKKIPLPVSAAKAGLQWCQIVVAADGSPDATAKASSNVVEPMLQVKQTGPEHCLVRAEPSYTIELSNPGTAATDPVTLHTVLPDGFEYVQATDGGVPNGKTVTWKLPSLAAGSSRSVSVKVRAVAAGDGLLRTVAQAVPSAVAPTAGGPPGTTTVRSVGRGLEAKAETAVTAEGVAAVRFEVVGLDNPVEVGKDATYEIRVTNQGTGPCSNVQLAAALADGTEFVGLGPNSPTQVKAQGNQLVFDPIPTLGVKGEMVYRVRVRGNVAGDLRFRVQLTCDQLRTPVVKEESTRFYKE